MSFLNIPHFLNRLHHPQLRLTLQPSLVLSGLALATFMKSSETGLGSKGREFALWLRDAAQSALDASLNTGWIDPNLAQAAFVRDSFLYFFSVLISFQFLCLFESVPHPNHSAARINSSIFFMDSLIQALSLTSIDAGDPTTNTFQAEALPLISTSPMYNFISEHGPEGVLPEPTIPSSCGCSHAESRTKDAPIFIDRYPVDTNFAEIGTLGARSVVMEDGFGVGFDDGCGTNLDNSIAGCLLPALPPAAIPPAQTEPQFFPDFNGQRATWPSGWSIAEIQKEEARRLCWSFMTLVSVLNEYTTDFEKKRPWDLYVAQQEHVSPLFLSL